MQEQEHFSGFSRGVFLQNVLQLHQQNRIILRFDSLSLLKIIIEEDSVLIPKNRGECFSSYAATTFIVALSPDLADISRFCTRSPITAGNHLDHAEKIPYLIRRLAPLNF